MYICKEVDDNFFNTGPITVFNASTSAQHGVSVTPDAAAAASTDFQWDTGSVIKSMIFTAITLCTIGGNGLVLLAMVMRRNTLKSSTHYFIASLSLADFLVGLLVMPFLAVLSVSGKWYFGEGYCRAFHCIHYWLCSASILSITAICVERFIGVKFPLTHFKVLNSERVVLPTCAVVWLIAGILSVAPLFIWEEPFTKPYDCPVNFQVGHVVTVMVFMFYIPCAIMLSFYFMIYKVARAHLRGITERRQKTHGLTSSSADSGVDSRAAKNSKVSTQITNSNSGHSDSGHSNSGYSGADLNSTDSCEMVDQGKKVKGHSKEDDALTASRKKQTSLAKKLFMVVGAFFVCYFPFFTTFMVMAIDKTLVPVQLFIALGWIRYFNSCLNPIIYASSIKPFRDAFRDIFSFLRRK